MRSGIISAYSVLIGMAILVVSCGVVERSSRHEFQSGSYLMRAQGVAQERVYLDLTPEQIQIYPSDMVIPALPKLSIPLQGTDSLCLYPFSFSRVSMDIDITTLPFKFRFPQNGLPAQLNTEFNGALYAGRRYDRYYIRSSRNMLGQCAYEVVNRGFDFGVFAGIGSTTINPFTTRGAVSDEYFAPHLQGGAAFFLESHVASFGLAMGWDRLLTSDRNRWIYTRKPWLGFIIGMALN